MVAWAVSLGWVMGTHLKSQQSLRWWHAQQFTQLHQNGEDIRESVLQNSFALRRRLELSLTSIAELQDDRPLLAAVVQLHDSLQQFSDRLSPPYLEDSLPLAIRYLLESWQTRCVNIQIKMSLPSDWHHEPYAQCRIVLIVLDELLSLSISETPPEAIAVCLSLNRSFNGSFYQLDVQFTYAKATTDATTILRFHRSELESLGRVFQMIMPGKCISRWKKQTVTWYFRWK
jgi:hypothetical protein